MRRRTFTQIATTALAGLPLIGRFIAPKVQALVVAEVPKSCCYIYNPGMDVEGVWDLTRQIRVIPGGAVTKISDAVEWYLAGQLPEGSFSHEQITNDRFGNITGRLQGLVHSARMLTDNLLTELNRFSASYGLVEIKEWQNCEVDVAGVNKRIMHSSFEGRKKALQSLPRFWKMTPILRNVALAAIERQDHALGARLVQRINDNPNQTKPDRYFLSVALLFGVVPQHGQVFEVTARLLGLDVEKLRTERFVQDCQEMTRLKAQAAQMPQAVAIPEDNPYATRDPLDYDYDPYAPTKDSVSAGRASLKGRLKGTDLLKDLQERMGE